MKTSRKVLASVLLIVMVSVLLAGCFGSGLTDIALSESSLELSVGSSKSLTVSPVPNNAKLSPVAWSSSDDNIVTVDSDGTVRAKSSGSAVITASVDGKSKTCNVTVNEKEITKLSLDRSTVTMDEGKTIQLIATVTPADATDVSLTWSSSDESIAIVNSEGYVTGVKDGVANIKCKSNNDIEASCTVTVKGSSSSKSDKEDNSNDGNTVILTTPYGHFAPSYVYSPSDFVFPDSSTRQLTRAEVSSVLNSMPNASVSGSLAQDAVNEIYARNGYVFKTPSIARYYESKPWYAPDPNFTTGDFNSVEKYNIDLLLEYT